MRDSNIRSSCIKQSASSETAGYILRQSSGRRRDTTPGSSFIMASIGSVL